MAQAGQTVPRITEHEQEAANNLLLFGKASTDAFLATIHHLRSENDNLRKENSQLKYVNEALNEEGRQVKTLLSLHAEQHKDQPQPQGDPMQIAQRIEKKVLSEAVIPLLMSSVVDRTRRATHTCELPSEALLSKVFAFCLTGFLPQEGPQLRIMDRKANKTERGIYMSHLSNAPFSNNSKSEDEEDSSHSGSKSEDDSSSSSSSSASGSESGSDSSSNKKKDGHHGGQPVIKKKKKKELKKKYKSYEKERKKQYHAEMKAEKKRLKFFAGSSSSSESDSE